MGSFKDGSNLFFITTPDRNKAKDFQSEANALDNLEWWCAQCGADPKEWVIEVEQVEPRPFCEEVKDTGGIYQLYNPEDYTSYQSRIEHNREMTDRIAKRIWSTIFPSATPKEHTYWQFTGTNTPSMQRTLTEICKDADSHYDDSAKLFDLMEEVKKGSLSESQSGFALEYLIEKMEALKDRIRKQRARNSLDRD